MAGRTVSLEKDVSETDRFGRLLRYVWLDESTMVNALLVEEGYAQVVTYPPDVRHVDMFLELQREARAEGRGLWGLAPEPEIVGGCHPAYPSVCIPPPPPDLDCGGDTTPAVQGAGAGPAWVRPRQGRGRVREVRAKLESF